jgi:hypothetical protein
MICVIIDHLSSMVHLVPSRSTFRARDIAELMVESIYKLHGSPEIIVSDRDSLFTSGYWNHIHRMLRTQLKMSTAFHPQTDGTTEHVNHTITQMLCIAVAPKQKDWVLLLPGIEFAFNRAQSEITGYSLFFLNYGSIPPPMLRGSSLDILPGVKHFMT